MSIRFYLSIVSFHLLRTPLAKQWCDWEAEVGLFNACNINKSYLITFLYILNLGNKALFFFSHVLQEWEKRLRFCLIFSLSQSHAHHAVVMHCFIVPQSLQRSWCLLLLTWWGAEGGGTVLSPCVPPQQSPRLPCLSSLGHEKEVEKQSEVWRLIKLCQL